jgi:PST family polysaccharide transporter
MTVFRAIIAFVTTILAVYFLPKLSVAKTLRKQKPFFGSFIKGYCFYFRVTIVYFTRFFIVKLLLHGNFTVTTFLLQLVGDVLKVASLILGYQFFAKN